MPSLIEVLKKEDATIDDILMLKNYHLKTYMN